MFAAFYFRKEMEGIMVKENFNMLVEVTGSEDGRNTYEVRRKWGDEGRKALVVELYPTISSDECEKMDLSAMHLLNHAKELGWNDIHIVNLYSNIFDSKPLVNQLKDDIENLSYIEEMLEKEDIKEYDIVIAWGNSLSTHSSTVRAKIDLLNMLRDKGLQEQTKCIVTENLSVVDCYGVHPLYLGLRYAKDKWSLVDYPVEKELKKLEEDIKPKVKPKKKTAKKVAEKSK